jgi:hypothetical protein
MAIALVSLGSVYVANANNHHIQKFNSNGTFIAAWGSLCQLLDGYTIVNLSQLNNSTSGCVDADGPGPNEKGEGQFQVPFSVEADSNGNVYVSDLTSRIQKFRSR